MRSQFASSAHACVQRNVLSFFARYCPSFQFGPDWHTHIEVQVKVIHLTTQHPGVFSRVSPGSPTDSGNQFLVERLFSANDTSATCQQQKRALATTTRCYSMAYRAKDCGLCTPSLPFVGLCFTFFITCKRSPVFSTTEKQ